MKDFLVGSRLGAVSLEMRNWIALKTISFQNPEKAAAVGNAIMAERLITGLPSAGASFLDIGAHIGSVFSAVHRKTPSVTLRAIEADATKAAALTTRFPYCKIINCAVGEERGTATFYLHAQSGYNSLTDQGMESASSVDVEVHTLDALLGDAVIDFIKIDIEGAELGALRGGKAMITHNRPTIMFESAGLAENSLGYSPELMWQWLDGENYQLFTPDRLAHDAPPLSLETFLDAHIYPMRSHNYFAVPAEKRVEIRDRARVIMGVKSA